MKYQIKHGRTGKVKLVTKQYAELLTNLGGWTLVAEPAVTQKVMTAEDATESTTEAPKKRSYKRRDMKAET